MKRAGVVASGARESAEVAAEIFPLGGNAIDAAVATTFATAIGNPSITSLAGGGTLLCHHESTGRVEVCDFFANAPGLGGRRDGPKPIKGLPILDDELSLQDATNRARIRFEDGALSAESFLLTDPTKQLASAAQLATSTSEFKAPSLFFGGVYVVRRERSGRLIGAGDPRRGGTVSGAGADFVSPIP